MDDLHTREKDILRAHTDCPDEEALGNLLFAYYKVGNVRNATNHAEDGSGIYGAHKEDSDVSDRMNTIKKSIENFIYAYDRVMELTGEDGGKKVVKVTNDDIRAYANTLKPKFGVKREKSKSGSKEVT